jgi:Fic family protein
MGRLVPVTGRDPNARRDFNHFAFVPNPLPKEIALAQATYKIVGEADRALGALNARIDQLPNPGLLIRPALTREAVSTSALEGTYAPLTDVFEGQYVDERQRSAEVREIQNYVAAALRGLDLIKELPICLRVVAELQRILVHRTRGDSYDSGELRRRLVCIGDRGRGIEESRFVPPPWGADLTQGVAAWERWINDPSDVPLLVKVAASHYQFETLHPFSDGNGRIGRLIITLQLIAEGALSYPLLNLSPWLEPRREDYIDHLLSVSQTGDFDPWVRFFASAVKARAAAACENIDRLVKFRIAIIESLRQEGARGTILDLASDLIGHPFMSVNEVQRNYNVSYPTANTCVRKLVNLGYLREVTGRNYGRLFMCDGVLQAISEI